MRERGLERGRRGEEEDGEIEQDLEGASRGRRGRKTVREGIKTGVEK